MIRCDDIFVDSDAVQLEKICQIIRRYDFDHLIGVTPLGEGKKLLKGKPMSFTARALWKFRRIALARAPAVLVNYRIKKMCGEKYIGNNVRLIKTLETEFSRYEAIPAIHGLHHYRYDSLPTIEVHTELSKGVKILQKLFSVKPEVFTPPFNAWDHKTELVCRSLHLSLDKCKESIYDKLINDMNDFQIIQLAKRQSSIPEVLYHPHRLLNLNKFELYLRTRRKHC